MRVDKQETAIKPTAPADCETYSIQSRHKRRWKLLGAALSATLFIIAIIVLSDILRKLDMAELRAGFDQLSLQQVWLAAGFTFLSYLMLTGYDALALRQIGAGSIGYRTTALASFTSYAVSFTLGFPLLTAGAVRLWVYGSKGLSAAKIASLTVIAGITFWLGMGLVLGFSLVTRPAAISQINHLSATVNFMIGGAIMLLTLAYFIFVALKSRRINVQGWKLVLPSWRVTLGQILLGVADVCAGGAVLFVLLPAQSDVAFSSFIAAYVFAHILGLASHAPGGAGVFETTLLLSLSQISQSRLFGAIILYRVFYYLIPFLMAILLLGIHEIRVRLKAFQSSRLEEDNARPESLAEISTAGPVTVLNPVSNNAGQNVQNRSMDQNMRLSHGSTTKVDPQ